MTPTIPRIHACRASSRCYGTCAEYALSPPDFRGSALTTTACRKGFSISDAATESSPKIASVCFVHPRKWNMCILPPQLGYSLNPDENYTLEELLELDLEPFQAQIDKVRLSASGTNSTESCH